MLQASTLSTGRGTSKSNWASSWRNCSMSIVGMTEPRVTLRLAAASSRVSQSSIRSRVASPGNNVGNGSARNSLPIHHSSCTVGSRKRLVEVCDDVVDVLDADTEPDGLRANTGDALLLGRHLSMCGRGRMTGERLRIAQIHQAFEE